MYRNAFGNGAADVNSGPIMGSGVAPDPGLRVTATSPVSASVDVSIGSALVHGTFYMTDATVNLAIASNGTGNPRIDTVVLQKSWTNQTVRLAIVQGSPAATPAAPGLTQTDGVLWEIPLADIAVASGFVSLAQSTVTPRRWWANVSDGVYLNDVLNNSGADRVGGDVMVLDTTADRAAATGAADDGPNALGVWLARTPAGGYGRVMQRGICYVKTRNAVTRGQKLRLFRSGNQLEPPNLSTAMGSTSQVVAVALETTSAAGLALCLVDFTIERNHAYASVARDNAADYTTTSLTWVGIDGTNLLFTLTTSGPVLLTFCAVGLTSANVLEFEFLINGNDTPAGAADGLARLGTTADNVFMQYLYDPASPVTNTFTVAVAWRLTGAGTGRIYAGGANDFYPVFTAVEVT